MDGKGDCADDSDECPKDPVYLQYDVFSSPFELIRNPFLRALVWIMAIVALTGNLVSINFELSKNQNQVFHCSRCINTESCNGPISVSLQPGNTAPFEVMSQRWRAVGNTVVDFTGLRFELQTYRSRNEHVAARPTGR